MNETVAYEKNLNYTDKTLKIPINVNVSDFIK